MTVEALAHDSSVGLNSGALDRKKRGEKIECHPSH